MALLFTAGCQEACWTNDYGFVHHGEHVTVYGYGLSEADACAGSFAALDRHVGAVKQLLWIDESTHYDYRWLSDAVWRELDPCESEAFACTRDGEALSRMLPDLHEAAHMVVHSIDDDGCPSVLDEGLAVWLDGPVAHAWAPAKHGIHRLLSAEPIPSEGREYALAGHFVAFLVERYGAGAVVRLCLAIPDAGTNVDWELAVARHLGERLDELIAEYERYPVCAFPDFRARLWECSGSPDFSFSAAEPVFSLSSGCADARARSSAWGPAGNAVITRRVHVPVDTWVAVSVLAEGDSDTPASLVSEQCARCSAGPQVIRLDEGSSLELLRAGTHVVSVFFDARDRVRLVMAAVGPRVAR